MKKFKKVLAMVMTFAILMSMVSVFATGDGTTSTYPGAASYAADANLPGASYSASTLATNLTIGEYKTETPAQHLFYVDGTPFILLDTDSEGNYFVMCEYTNGNNTTGYLAVMPAGLDDTYEARKFNPDNTNNFADTINSNIAQYVPSSDMRAQIKNTTWSFAADVNNASAVNTATCKLALPSALEFKTYLNKIGFSNDNSLNLFPQTPSGIATRDMAYRSTATENKYYPLRMGRYNNQYAIICADPSYYDYRYGTARPVFFLDKDFFKAVKCDVSTLGADAKAEVLKYSLKDGNVKICAVEKSPKSDIYAISNLFF